jgi:hypothetical protein
VLFLGLYGLGVYLGFVFPVPFCIPFPVFGLGLVLGAAFTLPLPVLFLGVTLGAVFTYGFFFPGATDVGLEEGLVPPYTPCPFVPVLVVLTLF